MMAPLHTQIRRRPTVVLVAEPDPDSCMALLRTLATTFRVAVVTSVSGARHAFEDPEIEVILVHADGTRCDTGDFVQIVRELQGENA